MTLDAPNQKIESVATTARGSSGLNVLIVDDEAYIRDLLAELLSAHSHQSDTAGDGEEALVKLSQKHFDVILTDIKMPRMDGFTLLKTAKPLYPDCAFVVMTAFSQMYSAREALSLGAEEYLPKPFHTGEVLGTIERAYQLNKRRRQNGRYSL